MTIAAILQSKGSEVLTVRGDTPVRDAVVLLAERKIGAVPVVEDGRVVGIMSERDIIAGLARHGAVTLEKRVEELMTWPIVTCTRGQSIKEVMAAMTRQRIRHLPVVEEEALMGIISIGDVVKHRLEELEMEAGVLHDLMIARG